MKWWQKYSNSDRPKSPGYEFYGADGSWIREVIWNRALQEDIPLFEGDLESQLKKQDLIDKLKAKYALEQIYTDNGKTGRISGTILMGENFAFIVSGREKTAVYVFDLVGGTIVKETQQEFGEKNQSDTRFYVLIADKTGFTLEPLPGEEKKLIETNYSGQVIKKFKKAAKDLRLKEPVGRIVLINGEPGTGKTYLVRGLIHAAVNSRAVVVPPSSIERLTEPAFITTLMEERRDLNRNIPIILIIEDADSIIQTRMSDNMPAVSALLNITEGIVGEKLNIRVIATTNAKRVEIDPAVLRPGRLSQHIEVGRLAPEEARNALVVLGGNPDLLVGVEKRTLAEVYTLLKDKDEVPSSNDDAPVGFML